MRSQIYVDKTGMLEYLNSVIDTEQCHVCVSRPRRFGKSITAEMMAAYYGRDCDSHEMFRNLKIASYPDFEKHLNQYDVIYADMNDFRHKCVMPGGNTNALESVHLFQKEIIRELREWFPDQVSEKEMDLPSVLTRMNQSSGIQFVIIIDEWDSSY